jgi:coenzyme F420-reducing hydrogenase beta subunit
MADYKITYEDGTTTVIVATEEMARTVAGKGTYELLLIPKETDEQKEEFNRIEARWWRDAELNRTDKFVTVTDHPDHAKIITYRQKLRDWPSNADNFPDTKPTI